MIDAKYRKNKSLEHYHVISHGELKHMNCRDYTHISTYAVSVRTLRLSTDIQNVYWLPMLEVM